MYKIIYWVDGEERTAVVETRAAVDELLGYLEVGTRYEIWTCDVLGNAGDFLKAAVVRG